VERLFCCLHLDLKARQAAENDGWMISWAVPGIASTTEADQNSVGAVMSYSTVISISLAID
jgi:hypothetical protein